MVVFRGTDDTLIGWKEDFHMTYMDHVPAQKRAASYLHHVMKEFPKGRFLVAGHSKGGNLATYACSYLPDSLFEQDVYKRQTVKCHNLVILQEDGFLFERVFSLVAIF